MALGLTATKIPPNNGSSYPATGAPEHERRFLLTRDAADAFVAAIAAHTIADIHDDHNPVEYTRTTYLDTDDFAFFRSSTGETSHRLRVREYACAPDLTSAPLFTGLCFLELKQVRDSLRIKSRISAPPAVIAQVIEGRRHIDVISGWRLAPLRALARQLDAAQFAPRVSTWYRRACRTDETGRIRITLDADVLFCRPTPISAACRRATPGDLVARGPERLLEVKYRDDEPAWLARALGPLTESTHFSKFRFGMQALLAIVPADEGAALSSETPVEELRSVA